MAAILRPLATTAIPEPVVIAAASGVYDGGVHAVDQVRVAT